MSGRLTESLGGVRVVKGYGAEEREAAVFERGVRRILDNVFRTLSTTSVLSLASTDLLGIVGAGVMYVGAREILAGRMTLGSFFTYTVFGWAFYPKPATNLRYVSVYRLRPVGYTSQAAELRIYSCHLKASQGFETDRLNEAIGIRDSMNAVPPGTHAILLGDFNIYTSTEPAFQKFLQSQADNDGRLYDPLNANGTWNNASFAAIHTQCPCLNNCPVGFGFAGGGLDDRFDMLLPTYSLANGSGLEILPATYVEVGNDGTQKRVKGRSDPLLKDATESRRPAFGMAWEN